jgi:hypothetical protein
MSKRSKRNNTPLGDTPGKPRKKVNKTDGTSRKSLFTSEEKEVSISCELPYY